MTDSLRQFIMSINRLQLVDSKKRYRTRIKRYLRRLDREWNNGSNERHQSEEAFLKIITARKG